jgi:hypothetical protein
MRRHARFAVLLGAAFAIAVPSQALGQAQIGDGSAASEYGDYVPTTSGHSTPTHHSSTPTHSAPRHTYTPPVHHYYAPPRPTAPTPPVVHTAPSTPTYSSAAAKPRPHHRHHKRHPHPAPAKHSAVKAHPAPAKHVAALPSTPASSVDGASNQLVWLGLAMISMTVAVFLRAGLRKRYGSV